MLKKVKIFFFLVLSCSFTLASGLVNACDCIMPQPDYDAEIFKRIDVIGNFEILEITKADWSKPSGALLSITLRVNKIYYGSLNPNAQGVIVVKNNVSHGCATYLEVSSNKRDLLLVFKNGEYYVADMCANLSPEGWKSLKVKSSDVKQLNYEQYYDLAANMDYKKHDINLFSFADMMKQKNTVVVDLRPKKMFDKNHIVGAIHLGADITADKLSKLIPSKDTTILLYCDYSLRPIRIIALTDVTLPQIYAQGYKNIYKLSPVWQENSKYQNIDELSKILSFVSMKE